MADLGHYIEAGPERNGGPVLLQIFGEGDTG